MDHRGSLFVDESVLWVWTFKKCRDFQEMSGLSNAWLGLSKSEMEFQGISGPLYMHQHWLHVWVCGSSMVRFYEPRSALLSNTWTVMCIYVLSAFLSNSKNEMCQLWSDWDVWARGWLPGNNAEVRNSWEYKVQNRDRISNWSWKTCFMLSKASGVCLLVFQWVSEGKFGGGCQVFDENYSIASLMKARNLKILV